MLSLSTPEYVVRNTVSAISSVMEKIAFLNSSKEIASNFSVTRNVLLNYEARIALLCYRHARPPSHQPIGMHNGGGRSPGSGDTCRSAQRSACQIPKRVLMRQTGRACGG